MPSSRTRTHLSADQILELLSALFDLVLGPPFCAVACEQLLLDEARQGVLQVATPKGGAFSVELRGYP